MKPMFLSEVRLRAIPSKLEVPVVQVVPEQPEDEFEIVGGEVPVFEEPQKQEPEQREESE